jgi:activator of HSP90 ATPase
MRDTHNYSKLHRNLTRRQAIAGAAFVLGGFAVGSSDARTSAEEEISHAEESIHQEPVFKAPRKRVYEALLDTKQFDKVVHLSAAMQSGMSLGNAPTQISSSVGGTFSLFGGHIIGRHVELVPSQRIVQAWRVVDWAPGIYSIAKFELVEEGSGTKIVFDHAAFPKGLGEHLAAGWKGNYWEPLQKYLG